HCCFGRTVRAILADHPPARGHRARVHVFRVGRAAADEFERWVASDGLDEAGRARRSDELKSLKRTIDQSLESMRANTEWVEREADGVAEWVDTALPAALATSL
ncbi:hypothetical protein HK405_002763, partial [Cladochytrium tenue]